MVAEAFVAPPWYEGQIFFLLRIIVIPAIIALVLGIIAYFNSDEYDKEVSGFSVFLVVMTICAFIAMPLTQAAWHDQYEVPSVQEKTITFKEFQVRPNSGAYNSEGMLSIDNADQWMIVSTTGETFVNTESGWFGGFSKWNTRDIFNEINPGAVIKVKYYGWREGKTSSFPNILSIEVLDESNATMINHNDLFGTKFNFNGDSNPFIKY